MDRFRVEALSLVQSERSPLLPNLQHFRFLYFLLSDSCCVATDGLSKQLQPQKAAELM